VTHFKEKCSRCGAVVLQCRCPGPKPTRWTICPACKEQTEKFYAPKKASDAKADG
jgi:hypothetical protein